MNVWGCHGCAFNGKGDPRCITCKRANQDDIRIQRTPHIASDIASQCVSQSIAPTFYSSGPTGLNLSEDMERVKALIYTVSSLHPLEFIAALHLARGGRARDIPKVISSLAENLRKKRTLNGNGKRSERSLVGMKIIAITERMPAIARFWERDEGDDE